MSIEELCSQESCTICLANYQTGASAGAQESYEDSGSDLASSGGGDVSSASRPFNPLDVGSSITLTAGFSIGTYTILSVSGGVAFLDSTFPLGPGSNGSWVLNQGVSQNCMMQDLSGREAMEYAARGKNVTHRAFFSSDVGLTNRHRITWSGKYLRVKSYYRRSRPGEDLLWVAELEEITTRMETASV